MMNLRLRVWRQAGPKAKGRMVQYDAPDISPDMSFLEMLDVINERLMERGKSPSPSIMIAGKGSAARVR